MLNKNEKAVMSAVYEKCSKDGSCLVSLQELHAAIKKNNITESKIKSTLKSLELDDYYDTIVCDKNGSEVYSISLHRKGYAFKRESEQFKRALISRVILAAVTAVITFIVGRILFYIFK